MRQNKKDFLSKNKRKERKGVQTENQNKERKFELLQVRKTNRKRIRKECEADTNWREWKERKWQKL